MFIQGALLGKNGVARVFILLLLVFAGIMIGQVPLLLLADDTLTAPTTGLAQIYMLVLLLLAFAGGTAMLLAFYRRVHHRSFFSLISPDLTIDRRRIFFAFSVWLLFMVISEVVLYIIHPANYVNQIDLRNIGLLLLVALLLIPVQTTLEELIFRGYLLQQCSILFNSRIAGVAMSAVIFGLMHMANPEVAAFGTLKMFLYYMGFGVFAGICTVLDDRLELAIGLHVATNIYGALAVTFESSAIQTPAMFKVMQLDLPSMMTIFVVSSILFLLWAGKRYHWKTSCFGFKDRIK